MPLSRDQRIDLARWLWDVGMSGRCREPRVVMNLGESVMQKLADDLDKAALKKRIEEGWPDGQVE